MNARVVRWLTLLAAVSLAAALLPAAVGAAPVASDASRYAACGRVFPDPHAYWPSSAPPPDQSPWAKGNGNCRSVDFLGWDETLAGLNFLASEAMFGDFVEVYNLGEDDGLEFTVEGEFADVLAAAGVDGMTAGLPTEGMDREKVPLYLIRVTDEEDATIPIQKRQHFAYALSIHGIERAGVEGGIRAIEDLATWGSCEKHGEDGDNPSPANCARENAGPDNPHPIMETIPEESTTAGEALKQQSVWFMLNNPDGWRRGDKQEGGFFYQRYNGNGVDMNRDWPAIGYTFRPYTPFSEPETQAIGEAMKSVKDNWTGGIDLHGQLIDRAFSFTLIGGSERPFDKDRRVLQFTKGAWADAEERLAWSPLIKPNDAPESDPRVYGVQWGTIWDTINYTVTGALGDWMDSPLGLNADGIDNEMSLSHLSNCGIGTCYITDAEQLHVDGNKSLIYAQMHYSLEDEDTTFDYKGRAAYLHNPQRVTHPGSDQSAAPSFTQLPPQEGEEFTINHGRGSSTHEFEVKGPDQGVYNGGLRATITWNNAQGVSLGSLNEIAIDKYRSDEEDPDRGEETDDDWQTQNSYFNQSFVYAQSGAQLDVNLPLPGRYRVRINGSSPSMFNVKLEYLQEQAWPDPGQLPYDVSNMDFFDMLSKHVPNANKLVSVPVDDVLAGKVDLGAFDTVVAADDAFLPGYVDPLPAIPAQEPEEGSVVVPAAGAGRRSGATSAYYEFDVNEPQDLLDVTVESNAVVDPDLYLQVQREDGSWSGDLASGETGREFLETLTYRKPAPGHYRLEVHNWAGSPGPASVTIKFEGRAAVTNTSDFTTGDRDRMAAAARKFAEGGGNLVLTDNALRALEWAAVVPDQSVREEFVYAGNVQFSADGGETTTYDDPLAANVDQPGAAEGDGHRHQIAEPVPTGYAIQDESGGDANTHPQWTVDRAAFDKAGGRVVGIVGSEGVTLGEIPAGDGVIRILGNVLPQPTEEFDHPYGLASYGVTYSGYEVMRNLLDWTRPINRGCVEPQVPASGFTDTAGSTHETNIECIAWYGITIGTSKTKYSPVRPITREQMASFIARLAVEGGLKLPATPRDAFSDDGRSVHEDNINALAQMGLVKGVSGKRYHPTGRVTRAQMASFIARVHKAATGSLPDGGKNQFPDDNGNVHERNINALAQLGVVRGRNGKYFPHEFVSRAQMASFVMHDLGLQIVAEKAYFGGAAVTLESPNAADGAVTGTVKTNKELRSLVADGCGVENQTVDVADDGSFTVGLGEEQEGQCQLILTATPRRPATTGTAQTVAYEFTVTVS